ncbi:MAG: ATP synthase F0 subunit B [Erysipelotrichia bacterium]|nr:ATP synthase F0 subunit B [Erysipelotrichia bacterium]
MNDLINIDDYLRINLYDAVLVLISTFLIVFIVKKFFWNYVREYLEKRQALIAEQLNDSASKLEESEQLKAQYEEKLANAKTEAKEIISIAKENASKEASAIIVKAKNNAEAMKEKATLDIENERAKVKDAIKEEISEVAFLAAAKVVEKELDEDVHKKYVDDFIEQVEKVKTGDETWQA